MEEEKRDGNIPLLARKERGPDLVETWDTASRASDILRVNRGSRAVVACPGIGIRQCGCSCDRQGSCSSLQRELKAVVEDRDGEVQTCVGEVR